MPSWLLEKLVCGALLSLWPGVAGARQPMLPFLAQGAGMAVEYAVVPGRCLGPVTVRGQVAGALQAYTQARQQRTAKIQIGSRCNQSTKTQGNADWVYGNDAWRLPPIAA